MKVKDVAYGKNNIDALRFFCPGCQEHHLVTINGPNSRGACWDFNGNYEKPTLHPSVMVSSVTKVVCHSFVTDGRIQFLGDSLHALAGQTVELPEIEMK